MKIWHISDTHAAHHQLIIPHNVDMVIHSGDCTNYRDKVRNSVELWPFIEWFKGLPIKHKVLIGGNHDSAIEGRMITKEGFAEFGITYLENSSVEIDGVKIWGSPITPTFNDWCFMMARHEIHRVWETIPEVVDILVTHGPPKTVLDLTENGIGRLEQVGCKSLMNRVKEIEPMIHCFGHVHDFKEIRNAGMAKLGSMITQFSNGACIEDGKLEEGIKHHGNILNLW